MKKHEQPMPVASAADVSLKDLGLVGKWTAAWLMALVLPSSAWDSTAQLAMSLATQVGLADRIRAETQLRRFLARQPVGLPIPELARRFAGHPRTDQLAVMRCYTPWGWRPTLDVHGLEHIEAARARGQGCLLWVVPTVFGSVLSKRSLAEAGLAQHHLSRVGHGSTSRTRLGRQLLTLPRSRLEDRWLAERIRMPNQGAPRAAIRRIVKLLQAGEVVTILVGANASRTHRTPFLDGAMQVSLGVPGLARQGRSALLPAITVRTAVDRFRTIIEPPLELDPDIDQESMGRQCVDELARRLEPHALAWPDQICWNFDIFTGGACHD